MREKRCLSGFKFYGPCLANIGGYGYHSRNLEALSFFGFWDNSRKKSAYWILIPLPYPIALSACRIEFESIRNQNEATYHSIHECILWSSNQCWRLTTTTIIMSSANKRNEYICIYSILDLQDSSSVSP